MRNRVFSNSPRVQLSILLGAMMVAALSLAGCGGGGGGSSSNSGGNNSGGNGGGGNTTLATISGVVKDTSPSHNPVAGALVTVTGTSRSATTDSTGKFVISNVPLNSTSLTVASPNPVAYYNYANYNTKLYDLISCTLPLPALVAGANAPFTEIDMYIGGSNPPPPPPVGGCPS